MATVSTLTRLAAIGALLRGKETCARALSSIKQTFRIALAMSALGQKQTYAVQHGMSALPPISTSNATYGNVRFGRIVDIRSIIRSPRRRERGTKRVSEFQSLEQSSNL